MNKLTKLAVMGSAAVALALSGAAQAAATRSGAALPVASKKVIKRSAPAAAGTRSEANGAGWALGAGGVGLTIAAIVIASEDGDSDG